MIYTKWKQSNGVEIKVPLSEEEMFSDCPVCGAEVKIDAEILESIVKEDELKFTSVYCDPCSDKYHADKSTKLKRIK